jgi:hypothetical protein
VARVYARENPRSGLSQRQLSNHVGNKRLGPIGRVRLFDCAQACRRLNWRNGSIRPYQQRLEIREREKSDPRQQIAGFLANSRCSDAGLLEGLAGGGSPEGEAMPPVLPSKLDYGIFQFASQLGERDVKRHVRDLLAALVANDGKAGPNRATRASSPSD